MDAVLHVGTTPWAWDSLDSADGLCAQAEVAETLGFDSFWLPENHFGRSRALPAPLLLLAAAATRTRFIRLGCTSYLLPIRHPLLAAEEVAVLDRLCGGRLILGVGRGIQSTMFRAFDVDSGDKRKLFQARLQIMRQAWRGEPVAQDDSNEPIRLSPLPVQQPSPPLWVAALGPLALQQVAGLGLPYLASPMESLDTLQQNYRQYHRRVAEAGLPPVSTIPVMRTVYVSEDRALREQARAALASSVPSAVRGRAGKVEDWAILGSRESVRQQLGEYIERLGLSHLIVRAGIAGLDEQRQLHSLEQLLEVVATL